MSEIHQPARRSVTSVMVSWSEFAERSREIAGAGESLFGEHRLAYLATSRRDGAPRLHPVTPVRTPKGLYIAVNHQSPKRWDLDRDGRYALHAPLGDRDEEFVITGRVRRVRDGATRAEIESEAGHVIHDSDWLFEFLVGHCLHGYWVNVGRPDTYPVRRQWRPED